MTAFIIGFMALYFAFHALTAIMDADWSWNFKAGDTAHRATRGNFGLGTLGTTIAATLLLAVHVGIIFLLAQP